MTLARALNDLQDLKRQLEDDFNGRLQYDFSENREIRIDGFAFPEGWQNRSGGRYGSVLIEIPEAYPDHPPRVYITDDMRHEGSRPKCLAPSSLEMSTEWTPLDIFGHFDAWDSETDSLVTVFRRLRETLSNPDSLAEHGNQSEETND